MPQSRMQPEDLDRWYVRNASGGMVPFSAFGRGEWTYGPQKLTRFNGVPAFQIQGAPSPGHSSGEAMDAMEEIVAGLPAGDRLRVERPVLRGAAGPARRRPLLYALSIAIVFLCLAALYESWSIPLTVLLVVPLGVFGAVLATLARGLNNDAYFQVGLLVTIGLAAKNAVLIVEFAKENFDQGMGLVEAVMQAARQRLRPILMTSLAFMSGVLPLALAGGAGSGAQNAVGTGVIGGMLASTFLAVFFVPVFFVVVLRRFRVRPTKVPGMISASASGERDMSARPAEVPALAVLAGASPPARSRRDYEQPAAPVPTAYEAPLPRARGRTPAAEIAWQEFFPDPELQDLIARALAEQPRPSHRDAERRGRARAVPHPARGARALDRRGRHRGQRAACPPRTSPSGESELTRTYAAGFATTAFELDLFGRVRSLKDAALERYFALEENRTRRAAGAGLGGRDRVAHADRGPGAARARGGDARQPAHVLRAHADALRAGRRRARSSCAARNPPGARRKSTSRSRRGASRSDRNALALLVGEPLPAGTGDGRASDARADIRARNCRPACRRSCSRGARTSAPRNTRSRPRMPTSAPRARRSSRASS